MKIQTVPVLKQENSLSTRDQSEKPHIIALDKKYDVKVVLTRISVENYLHVKQTKKSTQHRTISNPKKNQELIRLHKFVEGEIVWCKMRGFPNWPARVS